MPRKLLVEDTLEFVHKGKIIGTFKNGAGAALNVGDVVIYDTTDATGRSVTTTTSQDDKKVAGIVVSYAADDPSYPVQVQMWGPIDTSDVKVNGTTDIAVGDPLSTFTSAGISAQATSGRAGAWGFALEAYATDDSLGKIKAIVTCLGANRSNIAGSGTSVSADDGTAAAPSIAFSADTNSGFYRIGADNIGVALNGAIEMNWTVDAVSPGANNGSALGTTTLGWADLFLATGGVINWNNGEVTITETDANTLTIAGVATRIDIAAGILEMNDAVEWDTGVAVVAAEYSVGRDADGTNQLHFNIPTGATFEWSVNDTAEMLLSATALTPGTNDGAALGSTTVGWEDLHLATGGVINWANGEVTLTEAANQLTMAGGDLEIANGNGVIVGHTAQITAGGILAEAQVLGTATADSALLLGGWNAESGRLNLLGSRNAAIGSFTVVSSGDTIGIINAYGDDGVDYAGRAAAIEFSADAAWGDTDHPGRISFYTTRDAEDDITLSMRITNAGVLILGNGDGATTALTGNTFRAPNLVTGGAGDVAGADLTIAAGLGTGTGDVGTVIFSLPVVAAAGDNIQTTAARMTLDMAASSTQLTITLPQITLIDVTTGDLLIAAQGGNVAPSANDGWALGTAAESVSDIFLASAAVINFSNGNVTITHAAGALTIAGGTLTTSSNLITSASILADSDVDLRDGGTVTQATNITTGVTLNTHSGQITTVTNPAIAAAAEATFTVTNSTVAATDVIIVNVETQFSDGLIDAFVSRVAAGVFDITMSNVAAAAVSSGTAVINFGVIGGSAT